MIISVVPPPIPEQVQTFAYNEGLFYKGEFHFSITSFALDKDLPEVKEASKAVQWGGNIFWLNEFYFVSCSYQKSENIIVPHTRRSVIQAVQCPQLLDLYDAFNLKPPFACDAVCGDKRPARHELAAGY